MFVCMTRPAPPLTHTYTHKHRRLEPDNPPLTHTHTHTSTSPTYTGDLKYKGNTTLPPKDQMITAEPDVAYITLQPEDEFLLLACDGVWDVMTNQEVGAFSLVVVWHGVDRFGLGHGAVGRRRRPRGGHLAIHTQPKKHKTTNTHPPTHKTQSTPLPCTTLKPLKNKNNQRNTQSKQNQTGHRLHPPAPPLGARGGQTRLDGGGRAAGRVPGGRPPQVRGHWRRQFHLPDRPVEGPAGCVFVVVFGLCVLCLRTGVEWSRRHRRLLSVSGDRIPLLTPPQKRKPTKTGGSALAATGKRQSEGDMAGGGSHGSSGKAPRQEA